MDCSGSRPGPDFHHVEQLGAGGPPDCVWLLYDIIRTDPSAWLT